MKFYKSIYGSETNYECYIYGARVLTDKELVRPQCKFLPWWARGGKIIEMVQAHDEEMRICPSEEVREVSYDMCEER